MDNHENEHEDDKTPALQSLYIVAFTNAIILDTDCREWKRWSHALVHITTLLLRVEAKPNPLGNESARKG